MDTSIWGPPLWRILFDLAWHVPQDRLADLARLVNTMRDVLPCGNCRKMFQRYVTLHDPNVLPSQERCLWLWELKTHVNQKLGFPNLPFRLLQTRMKILDSSSSDMDVLNCLKLVIQNMNPDTDDGPYLRNHFIFFKLLPRLLVYVPDKRRISDSLTRVPVLGLDQQSWKIWYKEARKRWINFPCGGGVLNNGNYNAK